MPSVSEQERAQNVPTTTTCSDRDLDILIRTKPNSSTVAYESIIMWSNNKTNHWLSSVSENERNKIIDDARINTPK